MEAPAGAKLPQRVGRYDVLGLLETGGMAEILLGQLRGPSGFEQIVVIKRILPHLARDPAFVRMFLDEARIAAGVRHPNVVHVHELGQEGDDLFMVMEYLSGEPVYGVLRRAATRGIRIDPMVTAHVVAEAAAGLHAAHELKDQDGEARNVVHRDVSPSNVFITYDGNVKILDFGIAQAADRVTKTDAGTIKGKFAYMSPEQCRGEPLDRRSDVFSLGIVLYELLTARRLFHRTTQAATIRAVLEHEVVPPSELAPNIPEALDHICMKALSRSRRRRYPSAAQFRAELKKALAGAYEDGAPEERLVELVRRLFADRIEEKRELVGRVERGEDVGVVPPTIADAEVELPDVEIAAPGSFETSRVMRRAGAATATRRWALFGALCGLVALAAAIFLFVGGATPDAPAADTPANAAPGAVADQAPRTGTIRVGVASTPVGATVTVDGESRGATPLTLELPRGDTAVDIVLAMEGHEDATERLVPDVDQRLRITLAPTRAAPATATTAPTQSPTTSMRGATMRRRPQMRTTMRAQPSPMESTGGDFRRWD